MTSQTPEFDAVPPSVGQAFGGGVVRTVEALFPKGHYRITIDVDLTPRPPRTLPERGWTYHGHAIPGRVQVGRPHAVARCGGPGLCSQCSQDAVLRPGQTAAATVPATQEPEAAADAEVGVGDE